MSVSFMGMEVRVPLDEPDPGMGRQSCSWAEEKDGSDPSSRSFLWVRWHPGVRDQSWSPQCSCKPWPSQRLHPYLKVGVSWCSGSSVLDPTHFGAHQPYTSVVWWGLACIEVQQGGERAEQKLPCSSEVLLLLLHHHLLLPTGRFFYQRLVEFMSR